MSISEADQMINKLDSQIETLKILKKGEIPDAPMVHPTPITIKDTEVKIVEVGHQRKNQKNFHKY